MFACKEKELRKDRLPTVLTRRLEWKIRNAETKGETVEETVGFMSIFLLAYLYTIV